MGNRLFEIIQLMIGITSSISSHHSGVVHCGASETLKLKPLNLNVSSNFDSSSRCLKLMHLEWNKRRTDCSKEKPSRLLRPQNVNYLAIIHMTTILLLWTTRLFIVHFNFHSVKLFIVNGMYMWSNYTNLTN